MDWMPKCCKECLNLDYEWSEWSHTTFYYCLKNVWWPTKKQTCKKQDFYPGL
jgi:hypothetical protein